MHLVWTILIQKYMLAFIFAKAFRFVKFAKLKKLVINFRYTVFGWYGCSVTENELNLPTLHV